MVPVVSSALLFVALLAPSYSIDNGLALTPPMGFANWNSFGCDYNDATFRSMADAFVSTGLAAAGYKYMLVQECITPAGARDADGRMVVDAAKFPKGFKVSAFAFAREVARRRTFGIISHPDAPLSPSRTSATTSTPRACCAAFTPTSRISRAPTLKAAGPGRPTPRATGLLTH